MPERSRKRRSDPNKTARSVADPNDAATELIPPTGALYNPVSEPRPDPLKSPAAVSLGKAGGTRRRSETAERSRGGKKRRG
jgi:hypothetical protein